MINEFILDEIMKLPSDNSTSLMRTLDLLKDFNIVLINDENNDIVYKVKLDEIKESNLDNASLLEIRNGGWNYDLKKEFLIKNLNEK